MSNVEYYRLREQEERVMARSAKTPAIRAIHETMADEYAALARNEPTGFAPLR
jgi:hypothetical protein